MRHGRFDAMTLALSRRGLVGGAALLAAGWGAHPAAGTSVSAGACDTGQLAVSSAPVGGALAQTFVAAASGPVSKIRVRIQNSKDDTGNFVVRLLGTTGSSSPVPNGADVLATKTVKRKKAPKGDNVVLTVKFKAAQAAQIVDGTTYAVAVSKDGSDGVTLRSALGNVCPDGDGFQADATDIFAKVNVEFDHEVFVGF